MGCVRCPKGLEVSEPEVCRPFLLPAHTSTHGGGARVCRVTLGFVAQDWEQCHSAAKTVFFLGKQEAQSSPSERVGRNF